MPQLAFANSFWESYDSLEKPVKAGVRKAMQKFQLLSVPELLPASAGQGRCSK